MSESQKRIQSFEDLEVYRQARLLRQKVFAVIKNFPTEEKFALSSQMRRAAISLTNNIAEGFGRFHYRENMQFCRQSRGSLFELLNDLNICEDEKYLTQEQVQEIKENAFFVLKLLNGYIAKTKQLASRNLNEAKKV